MKKSRAFVLFLVSVLWFLITPLYAQDIVILCTGETHAMIYHCNCPFEPDGGIARRATLIKQMRKAHPNTLVLDSGGFFAGGMLDEYSQNTDLDMRRSLVNLKAMELMQYDAAAIGDDEFNFGGKFLEEAIRTTKLNFVSVNFSAENIAPYIIKEIGGVAIGIIGATAAYAKQKAGELKFNDSKPAVKQAVDALRQKGAGLIILLSHLGESEDVKLLKNIDGIDILVTGHSFMKEQKPVVQIGRTLVVRPNWQGRRLNALTITLENNKITNYAAEEPRLSDQIGDDPEIKAVLPACFADFNCTQGDLKGQCSNPGVMEARCLFAQPAKISLLIIAPAVCRVCDTETAIKSLRRYFPGLAVSYLYYPDDKSSSIIKDLKIPFLPVYLLGLEVEKENNFDTVREGLEKRGNFYMLKPETSGMSYLITRPKIKGKLDLLISLYDKNAAGVLEAIAEFKPAVHFLAVAKDTGFEASKGNGEVEECLRAVCVEKYHPELFFDYIRCRSKHIDSSWWEDCLGSATADTIRTCARGQEGAGLLRENTALNKELKIMFGPTYLIDNQEIFGTQGIPSKEEIRKILGRE